MMEFRGGDLQVSTAKDQIQGWKEIAAYLGRDERTAKRWEKRRGLPVRRIPGGGRANVYVLVTELEAWLVAGSTATRSERTPAVEPAPRPMSQEDATQPNEAIYAMEANGTRPIAGSAVQGGSEPEVAPGAVGAVRGEPRGSWAWSVPAAAVAVALLLWVHAKKTDTAAAAVASPRLHAMYRSPERGVDELYLQGVYFFEERTPASLENAIKAFSEVVERDPKDAPAYTGLAESYLMQREYATRDSREAYQLAREAADRALALDPQLPEAHAVLGFIDFFSEFNAKGATEQFRTAISLNANCVLAHHWYGSMMTHQGRYAEALEELRLAQRLEPTSNAVISSMAYALGLSGHRDEAIAMLDRVMAVDPEAPSPPRISAHLSMQTPHDVPRFLAHSQRFAKLRHDPESPRLLTRMAAVYQRSGEPAMWAAVQNMARSTPGTSSSDELIEAEAQSGDVERAMQMLLELAAKRDTRLLNLKINPLFVNLRGDRRFQQMLVDLNLTASN